MIRLLIGMTAVVVVGLSQPCQDCPLPTRDRLSDTTVYVLLRDRIRIEQCRSLVRTFLPDGGTQAVRIQYRVGEKCRDTVVPITEVAEIGTVGLGLSGQPRVLPILPVREFERRNRPPDPSARFIELSILGGVAGKDTSQRRVGSAQVFPAVEATIAPFGTLLGKRWSLGLLVAASSDGSRWRIPLGGHLRYWFAPQGELVQIARYRPDSCTFNESTPFVASDDYRERPTPYQRTDPSAAYVVDYIERSSGWQPFVFAEVGGMLNTGFRGAGSSPSLNPEEYNQWFVGGGIGTTAWHWLALSIAYRYQRLNVRTPCAVCPPTPDQPDNYVVNTAHVHSVILKLGIHVRY
jgi:hypothetical protein